MLACYGHMAIAFKAGVMPKAEGCNANQSAAYVNTHSPHCALFILQFMSAQFSGQNGVQLCAMGQTAKEAYLKIPTDRKAKRQPSIPSGMKAPMFVAYRAPAHQN